MPSKPPQTPPSGTASGRWIGFLLPSVTDLLFIAILLGLGCGALGRLLLRDADIGWHIRNGQQMWLTHAITRTDSFSSTLSGHTWYAWEWLYDLLIALIHHVFGLNGVVFYSAALIAAAFVLTLHLALRRGGNLLVTLLLLILSLGASAIHFLARPHLVSWLLTVIWFEVLDSSADKHAEPGNRIFWLPALMLLWVNLHGGFVLGFVLLAIYLTVQSLEYFTHRDQREDLKARLRPMWIAAALSFLASFVNPYGYHLHLHIYRYLSDRFLMDQISEFRSPDFHGVAQQCFAVLLLVTLMALASARRRPSPAQLLVILFAVYSGFYATRNLPASSLLLTLIIAPTLSETVAQAGKDPSIARWLRGFFFWLDSFATRMGKMELQLGGHVWLVLVFVLGLWACANHGRIGSAQLINSYFDDQRFPVQAAEVIAQRRIREPIFSLDYWGGYLIYRLYPETRVVLDDRHDLYGDQFFKDFLKVLYIQPGWDKVLEEQHVDWVLMPAQSTLATMLRVTPQWNLVYEDKVAALFHRVNGKE